MCSSLKGTQIIPLSVKAGACNAAPCRVHGRFLGPGSGSALCRGRELSPVMKVTALQNAPACRSGQPRTRPDWAASCRKADNKSSSELKAWMSGVLDTLLFQLVCLEKGGGGEGGRRGGGGRRRSKAATLVASLKVRRGATFNHEAWSLGLKLPSRSAEMRLSRLRKQRSQASPGNLSGCWFESCGYGQGRQ